jgi:hypothetical protein
MKQVLLSFIAGYLLSMAINYKRTEDCKIESFSKEFWITCLLAGLAIALYKIT